MTSANLIKVLVMKSKISSTEWTTNCARSFSFFLDPFSFEKMKRVFEHQLIRFVPLPKASVSSMPIVVGESLERCESESDVSPSQKHSPEKEEQILVPESPPQITRKKKQSSSCSNGFDLSSIEQIQFSSKFASLIDNITICSKNSNRDVSHEAPKPIATEKKRRIKKATPVDYDDATPKAHRGASKKMTFKKEPKELTRSCEKSSPNSQVSGNRKNPERKAEERINSSYGESPSDMGDCETGFSDPKSLTDKIAANLRHPARQNPKRKAAQKSIQSEKQSNSSPHKNSNNMEDYNGRITDSKPASPGVRQNPKRKAARKQIESEGKSNSSPNEDVSNMKYSHREIADYKLHTEQIVPPTSLASGHRKNPKRNAAKKPIQSEEQGCSSSDKNPSNMDASAAVVSEPKSLADMISSKSPNFAKDDKDFNFSEEAIPKIFSKIAAKRIRKDLNSAAHTRLLQNTPLNSNLEISAQAKASKPSKSLKMGSLHHRNQTATANNHFSEMEPRVRPLVLPEYGKDSLGSSHMLMEASEAGSTSMHSDLKPYTSEHVSAVVGYLESVKLILFRFMESLSKKQSSR